MNDHIYPVLDSHNSKVLMPNLVVLKGRNCLNIVIPQLQCLELEGRVPGIYYQNFQLQDK